MLMYVMYVLIIIIINIYNIRHSNTAIAYAIYTLYVFLRINLLKKPALHALNTLNPYSHKDWGNYKNMH